MRLAGILSPRDAAARTRFLETAGRALGPLPSWGRRFLEGEGASLGWWGGGEPKAAAGEAGVLAVLDGHIYNRAEWEPEGTDASLLAALFLKFGFEGALQRINGDFSAALYDPRERVLWLGRDRFGVKPLYYVDARDGFAFASRPRPLLALEGVPQGPDHRFVALYAASHYRAFDNDPESSAFAGVRQLPPGHLLRASPGQLEKKAYWTLEERPEFAEGEETLAERYRDLLADAVSLRLKSARRPAFTLSGGMDSSSVLASAARLAGAPQAAFSTVYADKTFDESAEIRPMLGSRAAPWHAVEVAAPDLAALVGRMIETHDEPVATATWLSHFLLCREAAERGFGSLFGGLGGDELNAGEYEYFFFHFADLRAAGHADVLDREVAAWARHHDHPVYRKNPRVVEETLARVVDFRSGRCLPDRRRLDRYAAALNRDFFDLGAFQPVMDHPFKSFLKNRAYQDLYRETIPCCLRAEDRQTEAFGLDNFLPFFDHRLAELMFRIPGTLKIRDGVTKYLLRKAMRGVLPEETRTRVKKMGWNAPAHLWFSGAGADGLRDLVRSGAFRGRGIYDLKEVERLIDENDEIVSSGRPVENHMMFLWQLLNLELWLRRVEVVPA